MEWVPRVGDWEGVRGGEFPNEHITFCCEPTKYCFLAGTFSWKVGPLLKMLCSFGNSRGEWLLPTLETKGVGLRVGCSLNLDGLWVVEEAG